jgi:SPP1 family predicted phage head-tail adaptor
MIRAGDLNEQVTIQAATVTRGTANAEVVSWSSVAMVWAKIVERGGREPLLADRPVMVVAYEVTIRAGVNVTHSDRLLWGDKVLAIDTVTPRRAEGSIVLRCMEIEI